MSTDLEREDEVWSNWNWVNVAVKDFEDSIRSKLLWVIIVLFVLFAAGGSFALSLFPEVFGYEEGELTSNTAIIALQGTASFLVPIISAYVGFGAIAAERESGSLKILLGLPATRLDVVIGKLVGRSLVVFASALIGFGVAVPVIFVTYDRFVVVNFVLFTLLTGLFALTYTGIAVGISAAVKTKDMAVAAVASTVVFFMMFWDFITLIPGYLITGSIPLPTQNYPSWYAFIERLSPNNAYNSLAQAFIDIGEMGEEFGGGDLSKSLTDTDTVPFYLSEWVVLLILLLWILIPVVIGYFRFQRSDLV